MGTQFPIADIPVLAGGAIPPALAVPASPRISAGLRRVGNTVPPRVNIVVESRCAQKKAIGLDIDDDSTECVPKQRFAQFSQISLFSTRFLFSTDHVKFARVTAVPK